MIPHQSYYPLAIAGLLWLGIMLHEVWPSRGAASPLPPAAPVPSKSQRQRANAPTPFQGLTQTPHWVAWEHEANPPTLPLPQRPAPLPPTHRRPGILDPSRPFCPHGGCDDQGGLGVGNWRATGRPSGGPWRQVYGRACPGYCLETHGTLLHGKRVAVELMVRVGACVAEGLGLSCHGPGV